MGGFDTLFACYQISWIDDFSIAVQLILNVYIISEGKDPSKHDFKPEWIVFWTARMKELHEEELRVQVNEIYRRMCLSPPDMNKRSPDRYTTKTVTTLSVFLNSY